MLDRSALKDWLPRKALSRRDKLLLVLAFDSASAKSVKTIRAIAVDSGLRAAQKWNISKILADAGGSAVRTAGGWELNKEGKKRVSELIGTSGAPPPHPVAASLRDALSKVRNSDTRAFLDEAVKCYEANLYRAAVVLSWVGAVSVLYGEAVAKHLPAFNAEALRRDPKWRPAKNFDGLARMKEADFLELVEYLGIIGKNVKEELQVCLRLRNACGHPSSLKVAENRVAAHVETLILNVFAPFT